MKHLFTTLALCACAAFAEPPMKSGIDVQGMDKSCKPCEDFWRYANGTWIDRNPIPGRYSSWGTMSVMAEANRERLRTILESAATGNAPAGSDERKLGDFYASCMDTEAIEKLGTRPIDPLLERIAALNDAKGLSPLLLELARAGRGGIFGVFGMPDLKDTTQIIANIRGGGISLPDRDYYFRDDPRSKMLRDELRKHMAKMFMLIGRDAAEADAAAQAVIALETRFASAMMTRVEMRDPYARYHKMDIAGLEQLAPSYDWKGLFTHAKLPLTTPINVAEPKVVQAVEAQFTATSVADWKRYLTWQLLDSAASALPQRFRDQEFAFNAILTGVKEQPPRWQTCTQATDQSLGDALGRAFVQKHFPPAAKQRMLDLVENLRATLREELTNAAWLSPETRAAAVKKLNAFVGKIGYPDRWRDYSKIEVSRASYFQNRRSAAIASREYNLAKIGKPVDKNDWGMTPPTVNAYYSPTMNEIAFPAGILQPPMFDMDADDAANYGAIGAVIGHEMGHGFDDQGSKFDAEGNLRNWWTVDDRKKFDERAACVIDQFNTLDLGEGLRHNGKLVVGEGLGDLGGVTLAYKAYQRSLQGKPAPTLDGFTGDQRFFLAFARVWSSQYRPEAMRLRLNTDPHPISKSRANATLQNVPEFHKAFSCRQGDAMVRPAEKQCRLW